MVHATVGGVSRGSVALVLSLRIFFVKYLLSSWYWGLALRLRSLLRGSCFGTVVPWGLASFYRVCGGGAGLVLPGPARLDGSLLRSWCLVLGPGCLVCRLPSVSFPWVGSTVGFWVPSPRPRNLSFRVRLRLIPSLPRAPCIFLPGLCRKRGWECWSGSSSTSLRAS